MHHHPLAHGHPARKFGSPALCPYMGNCSEPAWVTPARTGPGEAQSQQHTGAWWPGAAGSVLPPRTLHCPHHTLSGGAAGLLYLWMAPKPPGVNLALPIPNPSLGVQRAVGGEGRKICLGESLPAGWRDGDVAGTVTLLSVHAGTGHCTHSPCPQAAPRPTGLKLCPAPSRAKPSCSCCAGTTQSQEAAAGPGGWCRLPWALRPGPLSERARLSPAENMTSAGASARGETFLSCVAGSWTELGGWRGPWAVAQSPVSPKL